MTDYSELSVSKHSLNLISFFLFPCECNFDLLLFSKIFQICHIFLMIYYLSLHYFSSVPGDKTVQFPCIYLKADFLTSI
jgi:hypothetical protein